MKSDLLKQTKPNGNLKVSKGSNENLFRSIYKWGANCQKLLEKKILAGFKGFGRGQGKIASTV